MHIRDALSRAAEERKATMRNATPTPNLPSQPLALNFNVVMLLHEAAAVLNLH